MATSCSRSSKAVAGADKMATSHPPAGWQFCFDSPFVVLCTNSPAVHCRVAMPAGLESRQGRHSRRVALVMSSLTGLEKRRVFLPGSELPGYYLSSLAGLPESAVVHVPSWARTGGPSARLGAVAAHLQRQGGPVFGVSGDTACERICLRGLAFPMACQCKAWCWPIISRA